MTRLALTNTAPRLSSPVERFGWASLCGLCGAVACGVWLLACSPAPPANPDADERLDVGLNTDAPNPPHDLEDAPAALEDAATSAQDASTGAERPEVDWLRITLMTEEVVEGELIAVYDQNLWWDPAPTLSFALFDGQKFADFPEDRSVRIIDAREVLRHEPIPLPDDRQPYRQFLQDRGIVIGQSPLQDPAYIITGHESYHREENGFGDFAWDLVATDSRGQRLTDAGTQNSDYLVWDREVSLPTSGWVVEVVRDAPDLNPGVFDQSAVNNLVGVALGGHYTLYLLHFKQDTIGFNVQEGTFLTQGSFLGRVGNSGVTVEPHLHVALLWYDTQANPPRSWSVPVEWTGVEIGASPEGPWRRDAPVNPPSRVWLR